MPVPADLIIQASVVVPIEPPEPIAGGGLVVRDGRILEVGFAETLHRKFAPRETIRLEHHLLMPGLVNAHGHAAMTLLRGLADDRPLAPWLEETIWPLEGRWVNEEFVRDGVRLAMAEMIGSGTTCFSDMYYFPEVTAAAVLDAGMRAQIAFPVIRFPNAWAGGTSECIRKGLALHDDLRGEARLSVAFGPHSSYAVEEEGLARIRTLADELELGVHIHLHETAREVEDALIATGERPLAMLDRIGLASERLQAVHLCAVDAADLEVLATTGVRAIHCPQSNLMLATGHCDVAALRAAGVEVGLGTDGAAANNALDLFGEAKAAALLMKWLAGRADATTARQVLTMATLGGARALGLEDAIGSLLPGKSADVIAVDLNAPPFMPLNDPVSSLAYTSAGSHVSHVWVAGRALLMNGVHTTLDLSELAGRAALWRDRLRAPAPPQMDLL